MGKKKQKMTRVRPEKLSGKSKTSRRPANQPASDRTYKARLFTMVFSQKKELLELYNGVNGTNYQDPEQLEINTLENAIYMSMRNDLSFVIDSRLGIYEHQSTYSPNLPLRCLLYVSDLYSDMTKDENLYGTVKLRIPTPRFVIFYNGSQKRPEREILKLSELYTVPEKDEDWGLELQVMMLNINPGQNENLLHTCKTLRDYSEYTHRVRSYAKEMPLEGAVERAITECIREGILADFLKKNRAEAKKVSIYEYDEERHMRFVREEGLEEGLKKGLETGLETGKDVVLTLMQKLFAAGRSEDVRRASEDKDFCESLLKEFGLSWQPKDDVSDNPK